MPDLITLAAMKAYLGVTGSADDTIITDLLDQTEDLLERECGRERAPFKAAHSQTDILRGTGTAKLWLTYPIASVTSVKLGQDPANPEETLNAADPTVLVFDVGDRVLERTDGSTFGAFDKPAWNRVVYTTADDLPAAGILALKRVVAAAYQQRGSEDAAIESDSGFSHTLAKLAADFPEWERAVAKLRRSTFA